MEWAFPVVLASDWPIDSGMATPAVSERVPCCSERIWDSLVEMFRHAVIISVGLTGTVTRLSMNSRSDIPRRKLSSWLRVDSTSVRLPSNRLAAPKLPPAGTGRPRAMAMWSHSDW